MTWIDSCKTQYNLGRCMQLEHIMPCSCKDPVGYHCIQEVGHSFEEVRDAHSPARDPDSTLLKVSTQDDQESRVILGYMVSVRQASATSDLI